MWLLSESHANSTLIEYTLYYLHLKRAAQQFTIICRAKQKKIQTKNKTEKKYGEKSGNHKFAWKDGHDGKKKYTQQLKRQTNEHIKI